MSNVNSGTKLNPSKYKTFVPEQFQQSAQRNDSNNSLANKFWQNSKAAFIESASINQPIRTLEFVREKILNGILLSNS